MWSPYFSYSPFFVCFILFWFDADSFLAAIQDEKERCAHLRKTINMLPQKHRDTLEFLMFHLARVASRERENLVSNHLVYFRPLNKPLSPSPFAILHTAQGERTLMTRLTDPTADVSQEPRRRLRAYHHAGPQP